MTSRLWIEFHNRKGDGSLGPAMGSEGFQPVDGRLGIASAEAEARHRAAQLARVQSYEGFRLCRGTSPTNAYPVTGLFAL